MPFLNGVGGKVLFGVTNAGKIQGQDMADATYQEVANAIRKLEPPAWIEQIRVPVAGTKEVLILETTQQTDGPTPSTADPTAHRKHDISYAAGGVSAAAAECKRRDRWENQVAEGYRN